ncbi:MAG: hypothetical protein VYC39_02360, partial [Myxococcota bacterium]|nr:hypothetical protein [Myxococcota bacterium]
MSGSPIGCKNEVSSAALDCISDAECAAGEICLAGDCVMGQSCESSETRCGSVCCGADEKCANGVCEPVTDDCSAPRTRCGMDCCVEGQECLSNECVDRCETIRCGNSQICCGTGESCLSSGICCSENKECGEICCGDGEICNAGACQVDCGGAPPCGPAQTCCGNGEICYLDECITLGNRCMNSGCATIASENTCPSGEFCDPVLGRCLPVRADAECTYEPPKGVFDPVPLFSWGRRRLRNCMNDSDCQKAEMCQTSTCTPSWNHVTPAADDLPEYYQVSSIPMVADLDLDCVPEIVFNTYADSAFTRDGVLRAIRGDDGAKVWTVTDEAYRTNA